MPDIADPAQKAAAPSAKATEHETATGAGDAGLGQRPENEALRKTAALLNARPALVAQRKAAGALEDARPARPAPPNRTGLPERLKAGVEALSGLAMDDVRIHRDSAEPAKLGALAFTRDSDIHLGPGQEQHLPHEAWHVVQQKQGRVRPTLQLKGAGINADPALEHEADAMGSRAATGDQRIAPDARLHSATPGNAFVIQGNGLTRMFSAFRALPAATLARTRIIPSGTVGYRIDSRPPSQIRSSGFLPRVIRLPMQSITVEDIRSYQVSNVDNPGIVSTAETRERALVFARQRGATSPGTQYVYRVNLGGLVEFPQSENIPWWQRYFYSEQQEAMIAGGIEPDRIEPDGEVEVSARDAADADPSPPGY